MPRTLSSQRKGHISKEETGLLGELLSGVGVVPAQSPMEKGNGRSCSAGESSRGCTGHFAHLRCRPPPGTDIDSVPCCENKGNSDWGEETVSFSLIVCALSFLNAVISAGKSVSASQH